jgi:hypothetical protein
MAKEWYLMTTPYEQLSGYEGDILTDFAQDGFAEILESEMADDVEICNYNLSECKQVRAVIQNNVQDTRLKTLSRLLLTQIGTCEAGMYVKFDDRYWLITGVVDDNKMYEKSILSLCNYLLTWKNDDGEVVQRWANIINASQYNNGEDMVKFYTVRSDQLLVSIPDDADSLMLRNGIRCIIDKRCKLYEKDFDDTVKKDTSKPVLTYSITRVNNVIYDYHNSGHLEFMFDQDEQHDNDGYYVIDGKGYWLCESIMPEDGHGDDGGDVEPLTSEIIADSYELLNGIEPNVFIARFYDEHEQEVEVEHTWSLECDFTESLEITEVDNAIYIYVDDNSLINKSFKLMLNADGYETVSAQITIRAFI